MPPEVFVFAAANTEARRNRTRTIDRPVAVRDIHPHAARTADALESAGLSEVRCWGSVPSDGNVESWRRMQRGHWALLYAGERQFPLMLRVAAKGRHRRLARNLWDVRADGKTWELMYFFDEMRRVDLTIDDVRRVFAYKDWWPQGLQYPGAEQQAALLEKFGSIDAWTAAEDPSSSDETDSLSPEELFVGGPFKGVPAKGPRPPRAPREVDPDRYARGHVAHEETVAALVRHVGRNAFRKGTPGVNHDGVWTAAGRLCICEVKSITSANEVTQLQRGLGQVLHNRIKIERHGREDVQAYLIAEEEPSNSELWRELAAQHGVVFTWPERFALDVPTP